VDGTADKAISIIDHVKQYINCGKYGSKNGTKHETAQTDKKC
jgi:hypothetical protein